MGFRDNGGPSSPVCLIPNRKSIGYGIYTGRFGGLQRLPDRRISGPMIIDQINVFNRVERGETDAMSKWIIKISRAAHISTEKFRSRIVPGPAALHQLSEARKAFTFYFYFGKRRTYLKILLARLSGIEMWIFWMLVFDYFRVGLYFFNYFSIVRDSKITTICEVEKNPVILIKGTYMISIFITRYFVEDKSHRTQELWLSLKSISYVSFI